MWGKLFHFAQKLGIKFRETRKKNLLNIKFYLTNRFFRYISTQKWKKVEKGGI
jgi:hypothetical protein